MNMTPPKLNAIQKLNFYQQKNNNQVIQCDLLIPQIEVT